MSGTHHNRRRKSILKGRNSVGGNGILEDSYNYNVTGTIPLPPRKRVSFGQKQIKEFRPNLSNSPQPSPPQGYEGGDKTKMGLVDMDLTYNVTFMGGRDGESCIDITGVQDHMYDDRSVVAVEEMDISGNVFNQTMIMDGGSGDDDDGSDTENCPPIQLPNKTTMTQKDMEISFNRTVGLGRFQGLPPREEEGDYSAREHSLPNKGNNTLNRTEDMDLSFNQSIGRFLQLEDEEDDVNNGNNWELNNKSISRNVMHEDRNHQDQIHLIQSKPKHALDHRSKRHDTAVSANEGQNVELNETPVVHHYAPFDISRSRDPQLMFGPSSELRILKNIQCRPFKNKKNKKNLRKAPLNPRTIFLPQTPRQKNYDENEDNEPLPIPVMIHHSSDVRECCNAECQTDSFLSKVNPIDGVHSISVDTVSSIISKSSVVPAQEKITSNAECQTQTVNEDEKEETEMNKDFEPSSMHNFACNMNSIVPSFADPPTQLVHSSVSYQMEESSYSEPVLHQPNFEKPTALPTIPVSGSNTSTIERVHLVPVPVVSPAEIAPIPMPTSLPSATEEVATKPANERDMPIINRKVQRRQTYTLSTGNELSAHIPADPKNSKSFAYPSVSIPFQQQDVQFDAAAAESEKSISENQMSETSHQDVLPREKESTADKDNDDSIASSVNNRRTFSSISIAAEFPAANSFTHFMPRAAEMSQTVNESCSMAISGVQFEDSLYQENPVLRSSNVTVASCNYTWSYHSNPEKKGVDYTEELIENQQLPSLCPLWDSQEEDNLYLDDEDEDVEPSKNVPSIVTDNVSSTLRRFLIKSSGFVGDSRINVLNSFMRELIGMKLEIYAEFKKIASRYFQEEYLDAIEIHRKLSSQFSAFGLSTLESSLK